MCGIAGIFAYRESAPPVNAEELLRIREHMITRGPDAADMWISPDSRETPSAELIRQCASLIVDTRGIYDAPEANVVKA